MPKYSRLFPKKYIYTRHPDGSTTKVINEGKYSQKWFEEEQLRKYAESKKRIDAWIL